MEASWTDIGSAVGQLASAFISLVGFYFVFKQIKQTNKNLRQSNHTAIYSINTEIYKFFAEHSDLRPYFHEGKPLAPDDVNRNRVLSLSELLADFFEYVLVEKDSLAPEIREPWKNYIKNIYVNSSAFRGYIHANTAMYSAELLSVFAVTPVAKTDQIITVRQLQTPDELMALDLLYRSAFGERDIPVLKKPNGDVQSFKIALGLFSGNDVIGGISFGAVKLPVFEKLKSGELQENDLCADDFDQEKHYYYYISDLAIQEAYRKRLYSYLLLKNCIEYIETNAGKKASIAILGFSYSGAGSNLFEKIGFTKLTDTAATDDSRDRYVIHVADNKALEIVKKKLL